MQTYFTQLIFYYFVITNIAKVIAILLFSIQKPAELGEWKVRLLVNSFTVLDVLVMICTVLFHQYLSPEIVIHFLHASVCCHLHWNTQALAYFSFSILLLSLIARFSVFYLHRDAYFYKFFSLFYILELSIMLLILTNGINSIFIGWELLGLASVLLIAFYEHRSTVLKNSLIVLVIYKLSDLLLYTALIYQLYLSIDQYTNITNPYCILMILIACLIKSSIFPWIWLPRAMEGPTPSSAVFYGGLSTHIPVYIFMQLWMYNTVHNRYLIGFSIIGILFSSLCSTALSRQATDAKNAIAYAVITQLGIIYIEVLLGFYTLALFHSIINGIYRSFEFLKSPSLLYRMHNIQKRRKSIIDSTGFHTERLIPLIVKNKLYRITFHEFFLPRMLMKLVEQFLGFQTSRISLAYIQRYFYFVITSTSILYFLLVKITGIPFSLTQITLFFIAIAFHILSVFFKYKPKQFLGLLTLSILSIYSVLLFDLPHALTIIFFLLSLFLLIYGGLSIMHYTEKHFSINYAGLNFKSEFSNILILVLGFSIIGIPGLGTFYLLMNLEKMVVHTNPNMMMVSFYLITLNTITFFRFFYSNYLGNITRRKHYSTVRNV